MTLKSWAKVHGLLMPAINVNRKIEELFFQNKFDSRLRHNTPLLIYQMGKVASSSIYHSLKGVYPGVVLHAHIFNADHKDWRIRMLYKQTIDHNSSLDIISLTREPIGRNISAFFQNFKRDTGTAYKQSTLSTMELSNIFLENYDHDIPLLWFDKHIRDIFGIDVYDTPFPEMGFDKYQKGNIRLLVMRSEIDDQTILSEIREFLSLPDFEIEYRNVGSQKEYAEGYRSFRDNVQLPSSYIAKMCSSKYFNHFYDRNFIEATRQKWSRSNEPFEKI